MATQPDQTEISDDSSARIQKKIGREFSSCELHHEVLWKIRQHGLHLLGEIIEAARMRMRKQSLSTGLSAKSQEVWDVGLTASGMYNRPVCVCVCVCVCVENISKTPWSSPLPTANVAAHSTKRQGTAEDETFQLRVFQRRRNIIFFAERSISMPSALEGG